MPAMNPGRTLFIFAAAILLGASIFLVVALVLPVSSVDPGSLESASDFLGTLSLVHGALAVGALALLPLLGRITAAASTGSGAIPTRFLLRWAVLEGPALFGIVIVLLGRLQGALPAEPIFYANLVTYVLLVAVVASDLVSFRADAAARAAR